MSGMPKPRLALDLDDIERKLRQAQQAAAPKSDPLAELARIVGQDDPFQSVLGERPARPRIEPVIERPSPVRPPAPAHVAPPPAPSFEPAPAPAAVAPQARHAEDPYASPDFGHMVEEAAAFEATEPAVYDEPVAEPRRSRKSLYAVAAVLALGAAGLAGVLMTRDRAGTVTGEPPVVKAESGPVKVQPQSPGGVEIPNQGSQVYAGRTPGAQEGQTRVVTREEQPIDVRQAARANSPAATSAPTNQSPTAGLGEPRRVRTVSIKPDGTVIPPTPAAPPAAPPPPSASASAPAAAPPRPAAAAPTPSAPPNVQAAAPIPEPRTTSTPQPRAPEPARAAAPPAPPAAPAAAPAALPTPKPQARVAAVEPPPTAWPAEANGGYAVQLGVRGTEDEARTAFQQLQQKYTALSGRAPLIVQAESNGKTIYRVRVGRLSKDDATALCERVKSAGGQCFVAKS